MTSNTIIQTGIPVHNLFIGKITDLGYDPNTKATEGVWLCRDCEKKTDGTPTPNWNYPDTHPITEEKTSRCFHKNVIFVIGPNLILQGRRFSNDNVTYIDILSTFPFENFPLYDVKEDLKKLINNNEIVEKIISTHTKKYVFFEGEWCKA